MLGNLQIKALAHNCAVCSKPFEDTHLVLAAYWHKSVRSFEKQIEIGLIGADVRNTWVHFSCDKPLFASWSMTPDIHSCIRCKQKFAANDMIQPVFQVINPHAVNPLDPTDVGIALNERVYFVHYDCKNPGLNRQSSNILLV
jgi:hypothetical protein